MTVAFGANTELSRCFARSIRRSDQQPGPIQRFSHGFQPLSVAADKLGATRSSTRNSRRVFSVAKNNSGESLTYKDAGVDIDAGSELVRRIAKMAPGIGGFGGLFPLGIIFFHCGYNFWCFRYLRAVNFGFCVCFFYCGCKFC
jgi:phosphoribosylformylglycinamidine cyclo-ligase